MRHVFTTRHGDKRIKSGFLWFPKTIKFETRWLESAKWVQEYIGSWDGSSWYDVEWIDKEKVETTKTGRKINHWRKT